MKDRILEFLRLENKTSSQFAEEIGVQPSSVSHIVSGRNRPSLDFILKMLQKYSDLNSDWLLFGTGNMYKDADNKGYIDNSSSDQAYFPFDTDKSAVKAPIVDVRRASVDVEKSDDPVVNDPKRSDKRLQKVILIYDNQTFTEYLTE